MICYYHEDSDGICSAAIIANHPTGGEGKFIPFTYDKPLDVSVVGVGELVYIVDCTPEPADMHKLRRRTEHIVWIDHHRTNIDKLKADDPQLWPALDGIRDTSESGCWLTWNHFHGSADRPWAVKFINDYDIWRYQYFKDTTRFHEGLITMEGWEDPQSPLWQSLLSEKTGLKTAVDVLDRGDIAYMWKDNYYKRVRTRSAFPLAWWGYKCIVCNAPLTDSTLFGDEQAQAKHDIMITFYYAGDHWNVSLYSKRKDINVGELAQKYGGGGHPGAAGFTIKSDELHKVFEGMP